MGEGVRCASCGIPGSGFAESHVCGSCGRPQPVRSTDTYFDALGVVRAFVLDRSEMERRFYEVSRALHPDRFTASPPEVRAASLERMSWVNQAYATLRDPERRRAYLLSLEGFKVSSGSGPIGSGLPMELAETWFEVQDLLMEDPASGFRRLESFERELARRGADLAREIEELERAGTARETLKALADRVLSQNYLKSLARDIERLKARRA